MQKIASYLIQKHGLFDSFYIADMSVLKKKLNEWNTLLPRVRPFYAMKCNPDETILSHMLKHGTGFDCASKTEIATILNLGGDPSDIIFAHPVKKVEDLKYALKQGIRYTTFDSSSELAKIKEHAPTLQCVLRLRVDNPSARVQLGLKYGVAQHEFKQLIDMAQKEHIDVVGTSFHVGSASKDPNVFRNGIQFCREVFDYAQSKGFGNMHLLDIGGGFTKDTFKDAASVISDTLSEYFPEAPHSQHSQPKSQPRSQSQPQDSPPTKLKIIAEPGRYFVEEMFTFFTPIIGHKEKDDRMEYWTSDGLYGSFNCIVYDQQIPSYTVLRNPRMPPPTHNEAKDVMRPSILWGASCDTFDKITQEPVLLPTLRNGDFLQIESFGAYTISAAKDFNGIKMTNIPTFYIGNQGSGASPL